MNIKTKIVDKIFDGTVNAIEKTSQKLNLSYKEINVLGAYVIMPIILYGSYLLGKKSKS